MDDDVLRAGFVDVTAVALAKGAANGHDTELRPRALFWPQLAALPEPDYIVKGVIERGSFVEIYGPHGSGKSFFAVDLGLHIAAGWSWRGRRVKRGGILYVAAEGGTNIARRLKAFAKRHGLDLRQVPVAVVLAPTDLLSPAGIDQIIADARAVPGLSAIIIDTASRVMPGGKEDTEDMGKFVAACDAIRAATGAAVIVVHHTGKDNGRGSRGSVVLPAAVDTILAISRDDAAKVSQATVEKARDGEIGGSFSFTLKVVELGRGDDGDPITSCIVEPVDSDTPKNRREAHGRSGPKLIPRDQIALDALRNAITDAE